MLASNPDDPVAKLVRAFALPKEFGDGVRLASEGSGIKTATANLTTQYPLTTWADASTDTAMPAGEMQAFLMPNALRSFIHYDHNHAGATMQYVAEFQQGLSVGPCETVKIVPDSYTAVTTYAPHGPYLFQGEDNGDIYTPMSLGQTFRVQLDPVPATSGAGYFQLWQWDGKKPVKHANAVPVVATQGTYNMGCTASGDFFCTFTNLETTGGVTYQISGASVNGHGAMWCQKAIPNVETLLNTAAGLRVNFSACKTQNTANVQNKNGDLISCTISSALPWRFIANGYSSITALEGFVSRIAEKGNYVFNIPDSDNDIDEFYDDITLGAQVGGRSQATYPLSERQPYKAIALTVPDSNGRAFTFEVTHVIEYLTNVMLVEKDISQFSPSTVSAAVQILRTMASDYDNDTHIGNILATIGKYLPRGITSLSKLLRVFDMSNAADMFDSREAQIDALGGALRAFKKTKR